MAFRDCGSIMLKSVLCKSGSSLDLASLAETGEPPPREGKLRRVFTTHVRRRSKKNSAATGNVAGFNLSRMMKEPLRVVHSVPLSYSNG